MWASERSLILSQFASEREIFFTNLLTAVHFFTTECLLNIYMLTSSHNNTKITQWYDSCPLLMCWWELPCKVQYRALYFRGVGVFFVFVCFEFCFLLNKGLGKSFASAGVISYCLLLIVNCCGMCQDILTGNHMVYQPSPYRLTSFEALCTL